MDLGQFSRAIEGYKRRVKDQSQQIDQLNHILGGYIARAFHEPKKYPKEPLLSKQSRNITKQMVDDEKFAQAFAEVKQGVYNGNKS